MTPCVLSSEDTQRHVGTSPQRAVTHRVSLNEDEDGLKKFKNLVEKTVDLLGRSSELIDPAQSTGQAAVWGDTGLDQVTQVDIRNRARKLSISFSD